jgi:hypothetical protein
VGRHFKPRRSCLYPDYFEITHAGYWFASICAMNVPPSLAHLIRSPFRETRLDMALFTSEKDAQTVADALTILEMSSLDQRGTDAGV